MNLGGFIFACLYFFLPAYLTNLIPSLTKEINFLNTSVDFGKKFNNFPIFGSHKTWRGVIFGTLIGMITAFFQGLLYPLPFIKEHSFFNYQEINIFLFGFLISFGAILGDLFFAFIKRRKNIAPGAPFIPFDQINFVLGAFFLLSFYLKISLWIWLNILFLTFFLHIIFNHLGYWLGFQKNKW